MVGESKSLKGHHPFLPRLGGGEFTFSQVSSTTGICISILFFKHNPVGNTIVYVLLKLPYLSMIQEYEDVFLV